MFLKIVHHYFGKNNFQIKMTLESPFCAVTVKNMHVLLGPYGLTFGSWHLFAVTVGRRLLSAQWSALQLVPF